MQTPSFSEIDLTPHEHLLVEQVHEFGELFGFETRNKYQISDERHQPVAYAAEQQKGVFGFLLRQFLGHWRTFDIAIFNPAGAQVMRAHHPFRFFFQRLEIFSAAGARLGAVQQRFSLLRKRFDVEDERGRIIMEVASPLWKIWTFPFMRRGSEVATVAKKWSGVLFEAFTDKDRFMVSYNDRSLGENERRLVLAAAMFIDLQYFERKAD